MIAFAPQKLTQGMFLITSLCLMCPFYLLYFYLPLFRDHKNFKTFWLLINDRYHLDLCKNVFGEGIYPDVAATNIYYGGTKIAGMNIGLSLLSMFFFLSLTIFACNSPYLSMQLLGTSPLVFVLQFSNHRKYFLCAQKYLKHYMIF